MASERTDNPNFRTSDETLGAVGRGMAELIGNEQADSYISIVRNLDEETRSRHLGRMAGIFGLEEPAHQLSPERQPEPLHEVTTAYIERKFGTGTVAELELTDDDADGITEGFLAIHGGFGDPVKMETARDGMGMLLRGRPISKIADELGLRYGFVERTLADVKLKIDTFTILTPDEAREKFDKAILKHRERQIEQPEQIEEIPALAAGAESLASFPSAPPPSKDFKPNVAMMSHAPQSPEPAEPIRPSRQSEAGTKRTGAKDRPLSLSAVTEETTSISEAEKEKHPEVDLFDIALRNPNIAHEQFQLAVERMLMRAQESEVLTFYDRSRLQKDLLGYEVPSAFAQELHGANKDYLQFIGHLGARYQGRMADDAQPRVRVMRDLFAYYAKRRVPIHKLEEANGRVPVRLIVAGAISEIVRTASEANYVNANTRTT